MRVCPAVQRLSLPALTEENKHGVSEAWYGAVGEGSVNISRLENEVLEAVSLRTLITGRYVNDDVINYYGAILNLRNKDELF